LAFFSASALASASAGWRAAALEGLGIRGLAMAGTSGRDRRVSYSDEPVGKGWEVISIRLWMAAGQAWIADKRMLGMKSYTNGSLAVTHRRLPSAKKWTAW